MPLNIKNTLTTSENELYDFVQTLTKHQSEVTSINYQDTSHPKDPEFLKQVEFIQTIIDENVNSNFLITHEPYLASITIYTDNNNLLSTIGCDHGTISDPTKNGINITPDIFTELKQIRLKNLVTEESKYLFPKNSERYITIFAQDMPPHTESLFDRCLTKDSCAYDLLAELIDDIFRSLHSSVSPIIIHANNPRPILKDILKEIY